MNEWTPLVEDVDERKLFEECIPMYDSRQRAVAATLRIWANCTPNGTYHNICSILANEVAKMQSSVESDDYIQDALRYRIMQKAFTNDGVELPNGTDLWDVILETPSDEWNNLLDPIISNKG